MTRGSIGTLVMEIGANVNELVNYLAKALPPNEVSGAHCPKSLSFCTEEWTVILHEGLRPLRQCGAQFPGSTPCLLCDFRHCTKLLSVDPF